MNKHIISSHREAADSVVITFGVRVMDYMMTSAYKTLLLHKSTSSYRSTGYVSLSLSELLLVAVVIPEAFFISLATADKTA